MTLVEFLTARLDDEAAEIAKQPDGEGEFEGIGIWTSGDVLSNTSYLIINKSRALRDVEAKRRRIELHGAGPHECVDWDETLGETCTCYEVDCPTLRLEALPYAGHPDYREEWRP